jgi:hypothetical protein
MLNQTIDRPIDHLEQELVARERVIARLRSQQALLLRELDQAQVATMDGARSMHEWTASRLDVTEATARDLMLAAKAVDEQPDITRSLVEGEVSFDRAVATTRLAVAGADAQTLAGSLGFDLNGVARVIARHRRLTRRREEQVFRERFFAIQPTLDAESGRLWGRLPGFELRIVEQALVERADEFNQLPGPRVPKSQRMADALVAVSQDSLDGLHPDGTSGGGSDPLATVFVDADLATATGGEAGAEIEYGPKVGPATLERILCSGAVQLVGLSNGCPVVVSDGARAIPPAIRRFVVWRDGGCTADGCRSRYRLQPHHLHERSHGGNHDPDNLTTLCWFHHHVVVHGMGHRIDPQSPPARRRFTPHTRGPDPPG